MKSWTAVALVGVLLSLTGCAKGGGGGSPRRASSAPAVLPVAALAEPAPTTAALAMTKIPLVKGLTVVGAASERQGDYEASTAVDSIEPDGRLHLSTSADVPDSSGGPPRAVNVTRSVTASDLRNGRTYKYMFYTGGEEEYPGTTAMGTSAAVDTARWAGPLPPLFVQPLSGGSTHTSATAVHDFIVRTPCEGRSRRPHAS